MESEDSGFRIIDDPDNVTAEEVLASIYGEEKVLKKKRWSKMGDLPYWEAIDGELVFETRVNDNNHVVIEETRYGYGGTFEILKHGQMLAAAKKFIEKCHEDRANVCHF